MISQFKRVKIINGKKLELKILSVIQMKGL